MNSKPKIPPHKAVPCKFRNHRDDGGNLGCAKCLDEHPPGFTVIYPVAIAPDGASKALVLG
jgi:hypothetical protein